MRKKTNDEQNTLEAETPEVDMTENPEALETENPEAATTENPEAETLEVDMTENPEADETLDGEVGTVDEEREDEQQEQKEEIKFQRIMEYKAYRRGMVMFRVAVAVALAAALALTGMISIFFGITLPVIVFIFAAITILYSLGNEQTYNVYTARVVLRQRGADGRHSVPFDRIVSVGYKSAFYEKRLCVGTVTIKATNDKGKIKRYKMRHILDAKPIVAYINESINGRKTDGGQG